MKLKMKTDGRQHILPASFGIASMGLSLVVIGMMTYYLTTSVGLSGTIVGTILLCSRIFDGISDLIAGYIIDKCHFKIGKARSFDLISIPMWIFMVLCFAVPNLNIVGKILYIFLMYNMCQTVCYTFVSVSGSVRLKRTFHEDVRSKAVSMIGIMTAVLSTIGGIAMPILIDTLEYQPNGWCIIAVFFAVPGIIMSLSMFFLAPEMEDVMEENIQQNQNFVDAAKVLFKNKYLLLLILVVVTNTIVTVMNGTVSTYYFKYVIGDLKISSLLGLVAILGYFFLTVLPKLTKKYGNRKTIMLSYLVIALGSIARIIMPKNYVWLAVCGLFVTIGMAMCGSLRDIIIMDAMHYSELLTGKTSEGIYAAIRGFSDKLASGIAPFLIGLILDMQNFNGDAITQPKSALTAISMMFTLMPAIIALLGFVAMYFCKMEDDIKHMEADMKSIAHRRV